MKGRIAMGKELTPELKNAKKNMIFFINKLVN